MTIKKYILNLIKNIKPPKEKKNTIYLDDNITRFTYLSCAISNNDTEIIKAEDKIGGYYEKKLILPNKINISNKKKVNLITYIYRILFSLTSRNLNFYLPENRKNLDYIMLTSLLTVKKINTYINKDYPNIKNIIKLIYPIINSKRENITTLTDRTLLIEIIIKKLTYQRIKLKTHLSPKEKLWIYHVENIKNINENNLNSTSKKLYNNLCILHKNYTKIEFNQIWGYLYYKEKRKTITSLKNKIKNRKTQEQNKNKQNVFIKKSEIKTQKEKKQNLNTLFDYKKTTDKYENQKNKHHDEQDNDQLDILKNLNIDKVTRNNSESKSTFSSNNINNILVSKLEKNSNKNKKFIYKEWDFKIKNYKQNWCNVFVKKENENLVSNKNKDIIEKKIKQYKKEITLFREKFQLIMNKKTWIKNQTHGQDIDLDTIITNYKYIKESNFNKIYKYKKNTNKDMCISILFDSSLSTDSYSHNEKIIDFLKILTLIMANGMNDLIKNFSVSTFYSNTRHDCKYIIIKDFKNNWTKTKYTLENINPNGYTRIGPAIRHSVHKLKKFKDKQKIILLLSDGKPTDYDEYEGYYGINDVKHAINEANNEKIQVKSIITDTSVKPYFSHMFGLNNYYVISRKNKIHTELLKIFKNIIKV